LDSGATAQSELVLTAPSRNILTYLLTYSPRQVPVLLSSAKTSVLSVALNNDHRSFNICLNFRAALRCALDSKAHISTPCGMSMFHQDKADLILTYCFWESASQCGLFLNTVQSPVTFVLDWCFFAHNRRVKTSCYEPMHATKEAW